MSHGGVVFASVVFGCKYCCRCWSWTRILFLLLGAKTALSTAASLLMRLFNPIQSCSNNNSYNNVWMYVWDVCCWEARGTTDPTLEQNEGKLGKIQPTPHTPKASSKTLENEGKLVNNQGKRQKLNFVIVAETREMSKIQNWCRTQCPTHPKVGCRSYRCSHHQSSQVSVKKKSACCMLAALFYTLASARWS